MADMCDAFREYLVSVKKASTNTVDSYMRDIHQYSAYCASKNTEPAAADASFIKKYVDYLAVMGKSDATVTRTVASVRCYYRFLISKSITEENPVNGIKLKKTEKKLPGILDSNEIILLLSQPDGDDYKSVRDKAMLELLYATGIRVSELIELSVTDVNLQIGILHMHTGGRERIVPMYPAAVKAVADYLVNVRPVIVTDKTEDRLFTNMSGGSMSRQGFWKIIKHYSEKAGIKKDITPHTLRHSFAAHLLENGAQLKDIKEMLGHADISSTQVYAQFVKNKYTSAYARFHPLAR